MPHIYRRLNLLGHTGRCQGKCVHAKKLKARVRSLELSLAHAQQELSNIRAEGQTVDLMGEAASDIDPHDEPSNYVSHHRQLYFKHTDTISGSGFRALCHADRMAVSPRQMESDVGSWDGYR
jgi:hypothetical protein